MKEKYKDLIDGKDPSLVVWLFPILGLIVLILLPFILTNKWFYIIDFSKSGQIGDTIGGITGPVIALLASFLTFLAFWVQMRANKTQVEQFKKIDRSTKLERFETRFLELIRLHRENVKEFELGKQKGRRVFIPLFKEFKYCFHLLQLSHHSHLEMNKEIPKMTVNELTDISYFIFFMGVGNNSDNLISLLNQKYNTKVINHLIDVIKVAQDNFKRKSEMSFESISGKKIYYDLSYSPFEGHISRLGHYYRHLFQTVKYVVNQPNELLTNKYEYLKTLRAQLSSHEQLMLYYNSMSRLGKPWVDNNYLTTYRMIKNIPLPLANFGVNPIAELGLKNDFQEYLFEWNELMEV